MSIADQHVEEYYLDYQIGDIVVLNNDYGELKIGDVLEVIHVYDVGVKLEGQRIYYLYNSEINPLLINDSPLRRKLNIGRYCSITDTYILTRLKKRSRRIMKTR